jgi:hypothetical protein
VSLLHHAQVKEQLTEELAVETPIVYHTAYAIHSKDQAASFIPPYTILDSISHLIPGASRSISIIHTLDIFKNASQDNIVSYMNEWAAKTHASGRNSFLWVNPNAATADAGSEPFMTGPSKWVHSKEIEKAVRKAGGDALSMWNMTIQANRLNEMWYGQRVGIVQAMMVSSVNSSSDANREFLLSLCADVTPLGSELASGFRNMMTLYIG